MGVLTYIIGLICIFLALFGDGVLGSVIIFFIGIIITVIGGFIMEEKI